MSVNYLQISATHGPAHCNLIVSSFIVSYSFDRRHVPISYIIASWINTLPFHLLREFMEIAVIVGSDSPTPHRDTLLKLPYLIINLFFFFFFFPSCFVSRRGCTSMEHLPWCSLPTLVLCLDLDQCRPQDPQALQVVIERINYCFTTNMCFASSIKLGHYRLFNVISSELTWHFKFIRRGSL